MFDLDFVRDDVLRYLHKRKISDPRRAGGWKDFLGRASYAASMTLREQEIVTFAVLQWVVVALTYYLWVQIIGWIPQAVWESEAAHVRWPLNIVVTAWSLGCVALAAYPIGLLTGCTAAAHLLHQQGMPCSIARCLAIVLPRAGALWAFHVADGWLTVDQIVERLPKKKRRMSPPARASSELAYNAWKVGTVGMVPAIVAGHELFAAAEQSVALVKARLMDVLILRGSYSAACWVVGIGSYRRGSAVHAGDTWRLSIGSPTVHVLPLDGRADPCRRRRRENRPSTDLHHFGLASVLGLHGRTVSVIGAKNRRKPCEQPWALARSRWSSERCFSIGNTSV